MFDCVLGFRHSPSAAQHSALSRSSCSVIFLSQHSSHFRKRSCSSLSRRKALSRCSLRRLSAARPPCFLLRLPFCPACCTVLTSPAFLTSFRSQGCRFTITSGAFDRAKVATSSTAANIPRALLCSWRTARASRASHWRASSTFSVRSLMKMSCGRVT